MKLPCFSWQSETSSSTLSSRNCICYSPSQCCLCVYTPKCTVVLLKRYGKTQNSIRFDWLTTSTIVAISTKLLNNNSSYIWKFTSAKQNEEWLRPIIIIQPIQFALTWISWPILRLNFVNKHQHHLPTFSICETERLAIKFLNINGYNKRQETIHANFDQITYHTTMVFSLQFGKDIFTAGVC